MTNSLVKIKYDFITYVWNFIKFFGALGLIIRFKSKLENIDVINGFYENTKLILFRLASLTLLYFFIEFLFKKIWKNTVEIENIERLETSDLNKNNQEVDEDDKITIWIISNNGRNKEIEFLKKDNSLEEFIKQLKKRNLRLTIEY